MFKEFVVTLYKVMYNKQLNTRHSPAGSAFLIVTLFFGFLTAEAVVIKEIISHTRVNVGEGRIMGLIYFSVISFIVYLMLFKVFKVEPASDFGYSISKETSRKIWITCIINLLLFFILPVVRKVIFKL